MTDRRRRIRLLLALFLGVVPAAFGTAQEEITVRGRVVCLDSSGRPVGPCEGSDSPGYALESHDGKVYLFSGEDPRSDMLSDPRVRDRELQVVGWPRDGKVLEIVKLYSVRDGKLYDLYYHCDRCNITAHTPGLCWCCREPFDLREEPKKE